jgi:hypothetical protein
VTIELPALVLRLVPWQKRWLVCQVRSGVIRTELVYAQSFYRRSTALRAAKAAQERTKAFGNRLPPELVKLPVDKR